MKITYLLLTVMVGVSANVSLAETNALDELLNEYSAQAAKAPDAQAGQHLWFKSFSGKGEFARRSCTSCHTENLKQSGRHVKTNKRIEPMAPSVNPKRLIKTREIKKWLKRNCKWTLGRECTATEKANLLAFLKQQ